MTHDPWHELVLVTAAAVLLGGGAVFLALAWRRRPATGLPSAAPPATVATAPRRDATRPVTLLAAVLSVGAALIHLAAAPSHLEELGALGWGFVAAGAFQASWAIGYVVGPSRRTAIVGIAGNAAILGAWAWSRTVGLPIGPVAGVPEAVGVPDGAASLFQAVLVGLLTVRLTAIDLRGSRLGRLAPDAASTTVVALVPAIGVVFLATTLAVSVALGHQPAAGAAHEHAPGAVHGHP